MKKIKKIGWLSYIFRTLFFSPFEDKFSLTRTSNVITGVIIILFKILAISIWILDYYLHKKVDIAFTTALFGFLVVSLSGAMV